MMLSWISSISGGRIGIHGLVEFTFFVCCLLVLIVFLSAQNSDSSLTGSFGVILISFMSMVFGSNLEEGFKAVGTTYLFGSVAIFLTAGPFLGFRISQQLVLVLLSPALYLLGSFIGIKVENLVLETILA